VIKEIVLKMISRTGAGWSIAASARLWI